MQTWPSNIMEWRPVLTRRVQKQSPPICPVKSTDGTKKMKATQRSTGSKQEHTFKHCSMPEPVRPADITAV